MSGLPSIGQAVSIACDVLEGPRKGRFLRVRRALGQVEPAAARRRHEALMREFYRGFVSPGHLCYDVGANWGSRTRVLQGIGASVLAVEPQAKCARFLKMAYFLNSRVKIVRVAAGEKNGAAEMMLATASTLSSIAPDWVDAVSTSGRFDGVSWGRRQTVELRTLDDLIRVYGPPRFVKIDVEGFELQVLQGLSSPVPFLSFEFTPECVNMTQACVDRLVDIGMGLFNYSLGESMRLSSRGWLDTGGLKCALEEASEVDPMVFGDVYAAARQKR